MGDTWWRFYNTAPDHPKVLQLSDAQFRAWVSLNCLASKLGGSLPNNLELLAKSLRKSEAKTNELLDVLLGLILLDRMEDGSYKPHNWAKKQFISDVSTARVKRFRERHGNVSETHHRQRHSTEKKESKTAPLGRFDEFWLVCPKKTGRGAAEKAWIKALSLAEAQTLIDAMRGYAAIAAKLDKAFIKTPGPWLNEKRWLDEGIAPAETVDPAVAEEAKDKADRYFKRGKYAETYQ